MKSSSSKSEILSLIEKIRELRKSSSSSSSAESKSLDKLIHQLAALVIDEVERQPSLPLGPIALKALPGTRFSLEAALIVAHELAIPEKWARKWFERQKALGWHDSYGNKIRSLGHWLSYCWRQEGKQRPEKTRQGDHMLGGYADYAKHGPTKPPAILPIPKTSDKDWVEASKLAKQLVAQFREKQKSKSA